MRGMLARLGMPLALEVFLLIGSAANAAEPGWSYWGERYSRVHTPGDYEHCAQYSRGGHVSLPNGSRVKGRS